MKFTGSRLVITPAESDLVIDSGYDCFSKNTTIVAPKDWCAVIIQNGKHVANGRDTFTLSSIKHSRKTGSGIKFPLFGDLKIKILFAKNPLHLFAPKDNFFIQTLILGFSIFQQLST